MTLSINFKFTDLGQAAHFNTTRTGVSLNLTHIQIGSGNRVPDATEKKLVTPKQVVAIAGGGQIAKNQIRMSAIFSGDVAFDITEVGIWSGEPSATGSFLVAYWSQATGRLDVKSPGVDFVFTHDMKFAFEIPLGQITVLVDPNQSYMLDAIYRHESGINPHPQYTTDDEVVALINARVGNFVVASGTANAVIVTLTPAITSYNSKTSFSVKATTANTGAATLDAGGGAKPLLRMDGTPLQAGDIQAGAAYTVVYDVATNSWFMTEVVSSQIDKMLSTALQGQTKTAFVTFGWGSYAATPAPAVTAYTANQRFALTIHASSLGSPTLNLNGLGAKNLKQYDYTGAKVAAVLKMGQVADVVYDGVDFVVMNPLTPTPFVPVIEVPAGVTSYTAGASAPSGWLVRNGAPISRITYAALFAAISTTYGAGDGSTTFNLPDDRDLTLVGAGRLYGAGAVGGSKDAVVVAHTHGVTDNGHAHPYWTGSGERTVGSGRPANAEWWSNYQYLSTESARANISINAEGQSGTDKNMQPYRAYLPIIKF